MAQELSSLVFEVRKAEFKECLSTLKQLWNIWQTEGKAIVQCIQEISNDKDIDFFSVEILDDSPSSSSVQSK